METIGWVMLGIFFLGIVLGVAIAPTIKEKEKEVKVPISKEIVLCEAKGGKYDLYWSEYKGRYVQTCRTQEKDIEL